jgi:hypothetical protein
LKCEYSGERARGTGRGRGQHARDAERGAPREERRVQSACVRACMSTILRRIARVCDERGRWDNEEATTGGQGRRRRRGAACTCDSRARRSASSHDYSSVYMLSLSLCRVQCVYVRTAVMVASVVPLLGGWLSSGVRARPPRPNLAAADSDSAPTTASRAPPFRTNYKLHTFTLLNEGRANGEHSNE